MECPVCFQSFLTRTIIPRTFTRCGHIICHKCVKIAIDSKNIFLVKCPYCPEEYTKEEAHLFPNNYYLMNMLEQQLIQDSEKINIQQKNCPLHQITMEFYCRVDRTSVCSKCLINDHYHHETVHTLSELEISRKQIKDYMREIDDKCERLENSQEKFMNYLGNYQAMNKKSVLDMEEKFRIMIKRLTKRKDEVLKKFTNSTMMMNKYLKDNITSLSNKKDLLKKHLESLRFLNTRLNGNDMELNDLQDETWRGNVVEKVSDDLWKEFNLEGRSTKPVFEEVMREIESIELNFSQTPFFLINENVFNECLNNFIQIFSFDFGLENSFKLEKEIYLQGKFEPQCSDEKRIFKDINPTAILQEKSKNETRGMTFKSQANFSKDSNLMDENLVKLEENCNEVKVEEDDCNKVKIEEKNSFHSSLEKKSQTKETLQSERKNKTKIEEEVKQNKDVYLKEKKENSLQPDHKNEIEKHFNKLMKKMVKLESIGPCNLGKNKLFAIGTGQGEFNDLNNVSGEDSHPKFSASTDLSNSSNRIQWNVKQTSYYSEQTDHFSSDFQFGENEESTICLLGQNNKALYMTEKGKCELVTLDFEFINKEDKKGYVLKNFACCVAIDKNKVFYTGGGFSNDSYLLEFKSKTQVQVYTLPKMSQKRCWHGVIYSEPYAYIIGGYDGKSRLKDCERINLIEGATSTYENMNSMNEARSHFGYAFHNKAIYVVGGFGQSKKIGNIPTDTVEKYEIEKDKWTLLSVKLPLKLSGVSCGYFEDDKKIKIFGGNDSINRSTRLVFELDVHSDEGKLRECNAMLKKRQMNNKLYIKDQMVFLVGGTNESDCEIWKKFYTDEETIMEKTLFSYDKVIQGDLNCFSGFIM